jgi:mannose-1-phosphate guanylyltransferase
LAATVQKQQLLVQPLNKGTAPAILYALMKIACYAPNAVVAFFPSDHYFSDNQMFMAHVETAFEVAEKTQGTITLLGITPDSPEVEYGWIEPRVTRFDLPQVIARVRRFWEKPSPSVAKKLMERGCLWNSFVMVGRVKDFLGMVRRALPELYSFFRAITPSFDTVAEAAGLRELYSSIGDTNFSHQVLALRPDDLTVLKVERVGWSDLGDPSRVLSTLGRIGAQAELALSAS